MQWKKKTKTKPKGFLYLFTLARYILRGIPKEKVLCSLKQNHSGGVVNQESFEGEKN